MEKQTQSTIKSIVKSEKLVKKATTQFEIAIREIEKANQILLQEIAMDAHEIELSKDAIKTLENFIQQKFKEINEVKAKLKENEDLIEKLAQFTN